MRAAFRALARRVHPDVNPAPDADERFDELVRAYRVIRGGAGGGPARAGVRWTNVGGGTASGAGFDPFGDDEAFDAFFGV